MFNLKSLILSLSEELNFYDCIAQVLQAYKLFGELHTIHNSKIKNKKFMIKLLTDNSIRALMMHAIVEILINFQK